MNLGTQLLQEFDFRQAEIPDKLFSLQIKQSDIDDTMAQITAQYITIQPVQDGICKGDIVRISWPDPAAESGTAETQISVGRNFLDTETERQLLGHRAGETAEMPVKGVLRQVTVLSVKRRIAPALTDAMVAELGIPDVKTVEEYAAALKNGLIEEAKDERNRILADYVEKQVLAKSVFAPINEAEGVYHLRFSAYVDYAKAAAAQASAQAGGEIPPAEILRRMLRKPEGTSRDELHAALHEMVEHSTKLCCLGYTHAQADGVTFTEEQCDAELHEMAKQHEMPYEDVLAQLGPTLEHVVIGKYEQYFSNLIIAFNEPKYKIEVV